MRFTKAELRNVSIGRRSRGASAAWYGSFARSRILWNPAIEVPIDLDGTRAVNSLRCAMQRFHSQIDLDSNHEEQQLNLLSAFEALRLASAVSDVMISASLGLVAPKPRQGAPSEV